MRRPARWVLNALTVLSLLLCVTTAAMWRATASGNDSAGYLRRQLLGEFEISCCQGSIGWAILHREGYTAYAIAHHEAQWLQDYRVGTWGFWQGRAYPKDRRDGFAKPPFVSHENWNRPYLCVQDEYAAEAAFFGRRERLGFDFVRGRYFKKAVQFGSPFDGDDPLITAGTVPLWAVFALTALLPFVRGSCGAVRIWRSRRPLTASGCPACGYDLTGNVSGVCPEMFSLL